MLPKLNTRQAISFAAGLAAMSTFYFFGGPVAAAAARHVVYGTANFMGYNNGLFGAAMTFSAAEHLGSLALNSATTFSPILGLSVAKTIDAGLETLLNEEGVEQNGQAPLIVN